MNEQEFPQGSVPVAVAARVYGKDASWVRAGIVSGWLPIGKATRSGKLVTTIEEMDSRYRLSLRSYGRGERSCHHLHRGSHHEDRDGCRNGGKGACRHRHHHAAGQDGLPVEP